MRSSSRQHVRHFFGVLLATGTTTGVVQAADTTSNPVITETSTPDTASTTGAPRVPGPQGQEAPAVMKALEAKKRDGSLRVHLEKLFDGTTVSFGVPLQPHVLTKAARVGVSIAGAPVNGANVKPILYYRNAAGKATSIRSIVVQIPGTYLSSGSADVDLTWNSGGCGSANVPYASVSGPSDEVVETADRAVENVAGVNRLVETKTGSMALFSAREPNVIATFPSGYLAKSGLLGDQVTRDTARAPENAGIGFLSDNFGPFALSAMYIEPYRVSSYQHASNPARSSIVDPKKEFEGWLYDRCATFLTAFVHTDDVRFLRHAMRSCSYYADQIELSGANRGTFKGKPTPDAKYSHLRGLYAYYALTGDEAALSAGTAIADMWDQDQVFVGPYRQGHTGGVEQIWTERLLGTSMEGLIYGHWLTGDTKYLVAMRQMFETAYLHVTGDAGTLAKINPGYSFPPQNCFVHSGIQHEGDAGREPWCSGWMTELIIDPLLRYQSQTEEARVDEVFVRLARFLRDTGSSYATTELFDDTFLRPATCYAPDQESVRMLVPLYGSGIDASGKRRSFGGLDDKEHCADATALTAAAIQSLVKQGRFDEGGPIGPFASEGASFVQMHHELAACAKATFKAWDRPERNPANWTSEQLAPGVGDPEFVIANKIGFPSHVASPKRKLSWWFNTSMLGYGLLARAGVTVPELKPGAVNSCR